jgi:hypothetical protein
MTTVNEQAQPWPADNDVSTEELARRQGVEPIASLDELAQPELWDSDEEYEDFLADLYASRRSDAASTSSSSIPTLHRRSCGDVSPTH